MIIIYLLAFLATFIIFLPPDLLSFYTPYVRFLGGFCVIALLSLPFNLKKNDSRFTAVKPTENVVKRGLYHPLLMFTGFAYILSFYIKIILNHTDTLYEFIFRSNSALDFSSEKVLIPLVCLIAGILIYFSKWLFSALDRKAGIYSRAIFYVIVLAANIYMAWDIWHFIDFKAIANYEDILMNKENYEVLIGIIGSMLLIDLIVALLVSRHNRLKKYTKAQLAEFAQLRKDITCSKELEKIDGKIQKKQERLLRAQKKRTSKWNKRMAKLERKALLEGDQSEIIPEQAEQVEQDGTTPTNDTV